MRETTLCFWHHEDQYKMLSSKHPKVEFFLVGDGKNYFGFQDGLKKQERYLRMLYLALRKFPETLPGVREIWVEEVMKKYLTKDSHHFVSGVPDKLVEAVRVGAKERSSELMRPLEQHCYARIQEYFKGTFLKTDEFKEYVASYKLPAFMQEQVKTAQTKHKNSQKLAKKNKNK